MNVLILGATGFTGTALSCYLSGMKDINTTAIIHNRQPRVKCDVVYVNTSLQNIDYNFLEKGNFDYIFHLARIPGKGFGDIGRRYAGLQGALANHKLLTTLKKLRRMPKLIYLSGSLMYGHRPGYSFTESEKIQPAGYARYYYHAELPILNALYQGDMEIMMLRAPWVLGNGSWFHQLYTSHIMQHASVPVYGNIQRSMSMITVEDCAGMLWHYANNAVYNKVYNIYTFGNVIYKDFINDIKSAYNCTSTKVYAEKEMRVKMGKTSKNSICCEVVLGTSYHDIMDSYNPVYKCLPKYLAQLANK